jgi:hypothetical protein
MESVYTHDEKGKRQDVHAPSVINPGDYEYLKVGFNRKHPITGGPAGTCHHCGKAIVWEVFYKHTPSGKVVTFGYICAGILSLTDNRIDHEMVLLKRTAENERRKLLWSQEWQERRDNMTEQYPALVAFFDGIDLDFESSNFMRSLKWGYDKYGSLLPRQIDAALNVLKKREEEMQRKLNEVEPTTPLNTNGGTRQTLEGVIVSHKWVAAGRYVHVKTHKMLIKLDDGNKVYGSVPVEVERYADDNSGEYKGLRVKFDATVKASNNDEHFGFFNRPTKASVVE